MNTISRILGPSITFLCPLVGISLASDRVRFSKSNWLFDNVWPSSGCILSCHCICIIKGNEHYQQDSRALHHTFVSACWHLSCLSDRVRFSKSNWLFDNVWPSSGCILSCHCICLIKGNEHYQQDSRALHHTFVSACWHLSCFRSGQIFKIELAVRQCLAIKWWYTLILFLRY